MKKRSWFRNLVAHPNTRRVRKAPHRVRLAFEALEDRKVLSILTPLAVPSAIPVEVMGPQGKLVPLLTSGPTGYTPQQLQTAYGLNQVSFAGIKGDGAGQTIALVDAYDNPSFENSTDPNFATSALHVFDQSFGLPDPPSFTKVNQNGQASPLAPPSRLNVWSVEIAIDIEWAHAMAPAASLVLVEANDASTASLFTAAATAGKLASVVSMSWGVPEFSGELSLDSTFQVPGVTYLAGTGDHGAPGEYPANSPHVVAVGGTSLYNLDANGDYPGTGANGEVGWSLGSDSPFAPGAAGGGGISRYEPEPRYQIAVQSTAQRTIPDISADADPLTGVPVYDPYDQGTAAPWAEYGGTSLSSPLMAGMVALADQGRVLSGGQMFSSDQILADLYSLDSSKSGDFHDIIHGFNGFNAGPGYDEVTGLGTPNGSQFVPDLAYFGMSSRPVLTSVVVTPSNPSVDEGFTQQLTATGILASGVTQNITSSVVWASGTPSVATIDAAGRATTHAAGTSVITAALNGVTSPGVNLTSLPLVSLVVTPSNSSIDEGFAQQFTATGTFAGGSTQNLTSLVNWASATPSVATIDASGLATIDGAGTSVITAALDGVTSPGVTLTSLPLVALAVAPNDPFVPVLLSVPFTVTGTYSDGSTRALPSTSVTWASSQPAVATINSAGLATANALGTSVITASLDGVTSPEDVLTAIAPSFAVNTTDDDLYTAGKTSLRQAILAANAYPGHTITFDPAVFKTPRTITLTLGQLDLSDATGTETIKGPKAGVTISGDNASRVFQVDAGVTASLSGLTVSGGSAFRGAGLYNLGTLTLAGCTVSGNSAANRGGGLYSPYGASGSITLTNCTVSGNSAAGTGNGGGLDVRSLTMALTLTNSTVSGNSSGLYGGGIQAFATTTLTNCTVSGNIASRGGGDLECDYDSATLTNCTISAGNAFTGGGVDSFGGSLAMSNCTVSGNSAAYGGGVDCSYGSLAMSNCTVSGNSAYSGTGIDTGRYGGNSGFGGAVFQSSGTAVLTGCTVSGNSAAYGAGVCDLGGALTLTNCTVSGDSAAYGGGVYSLGTAALTNCTVSGNSASVNGGGVMSQYGGTSTMTLTNCTVSGNSAANGGGVFTNGGTTTTLTNCTVSGNSANAGGGISNQGSLSVASSTIDKNQATSKGGGISTTGGTVTITNTSIAFNRVNSSANAVGGGIDCENTILSLSKSTVSGNQATGGAGTAGAPGGDASGGGLYVTSSPTVTVQNTSFLGNIAQGGAGGSGAIGGSGYGGGIAVTGGSSLAFTNSALIGNLALGGAGGSGAGGSGAAGGNGFGGGCYIVNGATVDVTGSIVTLNFARGGHGKGGGPNGEGIGGGVYSVGTFTVDAATIILFNLASTSGDNIGP